MQLCSTVVILLMAGCGASKSSVTGEVSFAGRPIENGSVRFFPVESTPGPGAVTAISDGRFEIGEQQGLVAGKYVVQITAVQKTGRIIRSESWVETGPQEEERQIIPAKYNLRSELHAEFLPGPNTYDQKLMP
jgi:hypothetical protein